MTTERQRAQSFTEKFFSAKHRAKPCVSLREKVLVNFLLFISIPILLTSCFKSESYEKQVKSLDSLGGALNQKISELNLVDTVILKKAISKYNNYRQFVKQNINDTVTKAEADFLQQFYTSGQSLVDFAENRTSILSRGALINSQLNKLLIDAKSQNVNEEKLIQFATNEKMQVVQLIKSCFGLQQLFNANLQEFKLSIPGVETLIKSRNNGQMPTIITESNPL